MKAKTKFSLLILKKLKEIPRGKIATYKLLALSIGRAKAARAAGQAVGKNPDAPRVPCHRVIASDGRIGGYSGPGGPNAKARLLRREGLVIKGGWVENFKKFLYTFKRKVKLKMK